MSYIVIENTPGYLPDDDDPAVFDNLVDAQTYALELVERLLEHHEEDEEVDADAVHVSPPIGDAPTNQMSWFVTNGYPHDLGRVIEIVESEEGL